MLAVSQYMRIHSQTKTWNREDTACCGIVAFGFWLLILLIFTSKPLHHSLVGQPEHYLHLMRLVNTDRLGAANVLLVGDPAGQSRAVPERGSIPDQY